MRTGTAVPVVECTDVVAVFAASREPTIALQRVNLTVGTNETLAITGPSGSGKSTLLALMVGSLAPTAGRIRVLGRSPQKFGRDRIRRLGVSVQLPAHNLILTATVRQNLVIIRQAARGIRGQSSWVDSLLLSLQLDHLTDRAAHTLSGGEQQRLGLAIAMVGEPELLLLDEPTSQQDHASAQMVIEQLKAAGRRGATVVVVTHDELLATAMNRSITIRDGILGSEGRGGQDLVMIRSDGTLQLPTSLLQGPLPVGTSVELTETPTGALISRVARQADHAEG